LLFIGKTTAGSTNMFLIEDGNDKKYVKVQKLYYITYLYIIKLSGKIIRVAPDFNKNRCRGSRI